MWHRTQAAAVIVNNRPSRAMPMIVYEVTALVEPNLAAAYERFMRELHIPDLMKTGLFEGAVIEQASPSKYRTRYVASTREDLDRYLTEHAPRLRADFNEKFPSGVEVTREQWTVLEQFA